MHANASISIVLGLKPFIRSGVGILYLSPEMYWVTTTDFRDIERYRRKLGELNGNQIETIKALAREDIRRTAI